MADQRVETESTKSANDGVELALPPPLVGRRLTDADKLLLLGLATGALGVLVWFLHWVDSDAIPLRAAIGYTLIGVLSMLLSWTITRDWREALKKFRDIVAAAFGDHPRRHRPPAAPKERSQILGNISLWVPFLMSLAATGYLIGSTEGSLDSPFAEVPAISLTFAVFLIDPVPPRRDPDGEPSYKGPLLIHGGTFLLFYAVMLTLEMGDDDPVEGVDAVMAVSTAMAGVSLAWMAKWFSRAWS